MAEKMEKYKRVIYIMLSLLIIKIFILIECLLSHHCVNKIISW